jgi:hypothetical protein
VAVCCGSTTIGCGGDGHQGDKPRFGDLWFAFHGLLEDSAISESEYTGEPFEDELADPASHGLKVAVCSIASLGGVLEWWKLR